MSSGDGRWAELSSQNERVIPAGFGSTGDLTAAAQTQWAELASQSERLVDAADPLFRLAGSRLAAGLRLVATPA